jgi:hypothetical protein
MELRRSCKVRAGQVIQIGSTRIHLTEVPGRSKLPSPPRGAGWAKSGPGGALKNVPGLSTTASTDSVAKAAPRSDPMQGPGRSTPRSPTRAPADRGPGGSLKAPGRPRRQDSRKNIPRSRRGSR